MSPIPDDYVDVAERIRQFKEQYPQGSLQSVYEPRVFDFGNRAYIAYCAAAYRDPNDERPGIGWAWEPVPGPTPFTKDSELMNAETSAWGRAIVALGFETKKIAASNEVRNRQASSERGEGSRREGSSQAAEAQPRSEGAAAGFTAPQGAAEKPATDGLLHQMNLTLKLLNGSFPEHPGQGRTWEDMAKSYCTDKFGKESVRDLSVAQVNELNDWLEEQYRVAMQEMAVPFG